jgi:uncharacterized protein (DUF2147 family)
MFKYAARPAFLIRVLMFVAGLMTMPALAMETGAIQTSPMQTGAPLIASPVGTWSTANGHGVIEITQCGDALCGRIVGIERSAGEPMPTDVLGRPQCGLTIITNQKLKVNGTWRGEITDPRSGGTYQAMLWVDQGGDLHLRGFIGIPQLGATQIWHKFTGRLANDCRLA